MQVFRQRFVNLTREACNYLGSHYHDITEQLLKSVDLLIAQFECPRVYADVELVRERRGDVCMSVGEEDKLWRSEIHFSTLKHNNW